MDTYSYVFLGVNTFIALVNLIFTFLLHFRFRSKCGKFSCLAAPKTPKQTHSPIVPMEEEDVETPKEEDEEKQT